MNKSTPLKRLFASIIDNLIAFILCIIILAIAEYNESGFMFFLAPLVPILIQFYFWKKSTSLGKHMLNMKVVKIDTEQELSFWLMFVRETIGKYISGLVFSLGFIWILFDKDRQCWHDKLVGSIVVDI